MTDSTVRLVVTGRVQGVGFRWYVAESARRLGVAGWVKNRSDGSVEICAAGSAAALSELEQIVRRGPSGAAVSDVARAERRTEGELTKPFSIARD